MKKIINPWKGLEGYNCFGCAPNNEAGVRMEFYEDGDEIVSIWKPRPEYQGWIDTLHGGDDREAIRPSPSSVLSRHRQVSWPGCGI